MDVAFLEAQMEHKFAPVPLLAVQGLVNTYEYEVEEELIGTPGEAETWFSNAGLLAPGVIMGRKEHEEILTLRRVLREMLTSSSDGFDGGALEELGRLAANHPTRFEVDRVGQVRLPTGPAVEIGDLIGRLIGIVSLAQELGWWERLKICAADECRWAFYDASKNRGGTWCRMEVCGNRTKNRRYRAKSS